jgi:hypothetical protein
LPETVTLVPAARGPALGVTEVTPGGPDTVTVGELARLVRVPDEVDFSWVVKVDVPALEGASADEAPPPAP